LEFEPPHFDLATKSASKWSIGQMSDE
jgi:hypothetical protein